MALINCPECDKEISDKAISCPNCGVPINEKPTVENNDEYLCCPKCNSKDLHTEKKGFSGKNAVAGAVLTGGIGLLAGTIGSNDIQIHCLKCGNKFKAGEAKIVSNKIEVYDDELDNKMLNICKEKGKLKGITEYKALKGTDLETSKKYIDDLCERKGFVANSSNAGCMPIVALVVISSLSTLFML